MTEILLFTLIVVIGLLLVPALVLLIECLASLLPGRSVTYESQPRRTVIVMPAHDEAAGIGDTLLALASHLDDQTSVLVVADNCTDETASIARSAGARVVERVDPDRRGKGYAIRAGLDALASDPPDIVVLMDADCVVESGRVTQLADAAAVTGRPVQATYVMSVPAKPRPTDVVSGFSFLVKNLVRPLGLHRLGLPCLLTGSGMAFPWETLRSARLEHDNIVEDMQLGLDLALAGSPPMLCPDVVVRSTLPATRSAVVSQRTRWEFGHLSMMFRQGPRLFIKGLATLRPGLVGLALELCVPPLALLITLFLVAGMAALVTGLTGVHWLPFIVIAATGVIALVIMMAVAWRHGREFGPRALLAAPLYLLGKQPMYLRFLTRPNVEWVRTARDPIGESDDDAGATDGTHEKVTS